MLYHHNENYYSYCCTVLCAQHLGASAVLRGEAPGGAGLQGRRGHGRRALVGTRTLASNDRPGAEPVGVSIIEVLVLRTRAHTRTHSGIY